MGIIFKLMDQNLLQQLLGAQLGGLQNQEAQEEPKTNNLQFRAGMMKRVGTTVTADARKGYVRVFKDENQLTHFTWKERTKQGTEMDLMLFPDDAEVFTIPTPPSTGRCFALRLKAANRINFFWLQEPSDAKDAENITKMNGLLNPGGASENNSTAAQASEPAAAAVPAGDAEEDDALQAALAMSMQVDEPAAAVTPAAVPAAGDTEEDDALQAALAMSMQVDEPAVTPPAAAPAVTPAAPAPAPAGDMSMEDEEDAALQAAIAMSMAASEKPPSDDDSDLYE